MDWYRFTFLESIENLKSVAYAHSGRELNTARAREIISCLQQGRFFYQTAELAPLEIKPLLLFYGMVGLSKGLILFRSGCGIETLSPSHGLRDDKSIRKGRLEDLTILIGSKGTFAEFNECVAVLSRAVLSDPFIGEVSIRKPAARAAEISDMKIALKDVLSRVPGLEELYQATYRDRANTTTMGLYSEHGGYSSTILTITDKELFTDRHSLKRIVDGWRERFPFLRAWRIKSAQNYQTSNFITLENIYPDADECSEASSVLDASGLTCLPKETDRERCFKVEDEIQGADYKSGAHFIAPFQGHVISEFSYHYLGLFLLGSLVRYRPQVWSHVITGSVVEGFPADDRSLSLIERFLDLNCSEMPKMIVDVINPELNLR